MILPFRLSLRPFAARPMGAGVDPRTWFGQRTCLSNDHLSVGAVFQDAPFAPELVIVPAGQFLVPSWGPYRGNLKSKGISNAAEVPVTFERPFAIGRFAVTFDEFKSFHDWSVKNMVAGVHGLGNIELDSPMSAVNVSWDQAVAYCNWLDEMTGLPEGTYHLPSILEWEYAAFAGESGPHSWDGLKSSIVKADNKTPELDSVLIGEGLNQGVSVKKFNPNAWGLYSVFETSGVVRRQKRYRRPSPRYSSKKGTRKDRFRVAHGGPWGNGSRQSARCRDQATIAGVTLVFEWRGHSCIKPSVNLHRVAIETIVVEVIIFTLGRAIVWQQRPRMASIIAPNCLINKGHWLSIAKNDLSS